MAATLKLCISFDNERYNVIYCATFAGVQEGGVGRGTGFAQNKRKDSA